MRLGAIALAVALLTTGCIGADAPDDTDASLATGEAGRRDPSDGVTNAGVDEVGDAVPVPTAWVLTADGRLVEAPENDVAEEIPLPSTTPAFIAGQFLSASGKAPSLPRALHVTAAEITVHYTHGSVGVNVIGTAFGGFPPVAYVLGWDDVFMPFGFADAPDVVRQGEIITVKISAALPNGGLVIPAGKEPTFGVFSVYDQVDAAGGMRVLVNAVGRETGVTFSGMWMDEPADTREAPTTTENIQLTGDVCTGVGADTARVELPFDVPANAVGLTLVAKRTGGTAVTGTDIDVWLLNAAGDAVASSHLPFDVETIVLGEPNFAAAGTGAWKIRVTSCAIQQANVEIQSTLRLAGEVASEA